MTRFSGILLSICLAAAPALAGTISISITQSAELKDGSLAVKLTVRNSGDEAARSVAPVLRFGDKEARGQVRASLEPNTSMEETLTVPATGLADGRWPYRLAVDYTDVNQYPFQALEVQTVQIGNPPPAKLTVQGVSIEGGLAGTGELAVPLKNLTADARTLRLGVHLPEGVEASQPDRSMTLAGWGDEVVEVPVTNRTALVGSTYPIFVTAEYDDAGVHHTVVGRGMMKVVGETSRLERWRPWLMYGAGALVVAWVAVVLLRTRRR